MQKRIFYRETAYALGLLLLAVGTAMTAFGNFGISVVVAPAYVLYLKLSQYWSFFTFGMAEYILQLLLLGLLALTVRKFRPVWLLSFGFTLAYGLILDTSMLVLQTLPTLLWVRIAVYCTGVFLCAVGIALLFRTYLPPAVYELFVKEVTREKGIRVHPFKTVYDCVSCLTAIVLSLVLLGGLQGVGIGTVLLAIGNGTLIYLIGGFLNKHYLFQDRFPWRHYFTESEES